MKTLRFAGMALLVVVVCMGLTACGDDDEPNGDGGGTGSTSVVNPANVFTGGLPKSWHQMRLKDALGPTSPR